MPWNVKRDGAVLEVQISMPVGSWGALFDAVQRNRGSDLRGAIVPTHLSGAPPIDRVLLKRFRDELTVSGVQLLEPAIV
jgi:hypothetical protein